MSAGSSDGEFLEYGAEPDEPTAEGRMLGGLFVRAVVYEGGERQEEGPLSAVQTKPRRTVALTSRQVRDVVARKAR